MAVRMMLDAGADPTMVCTAGDTCMSIAQRYGYRGIVSILKVSSSGTSSNNSSNSSRSSSGRSSSDRSLSFSSVSTALTGSRVSKG